MQQKTPFWPTLPGRIWWGRPRFRHRRPPCCSTSLALCKRCCRVSSPSSCLIRPSELQQSCDEGHVLCNA